MDPLPPPPSPPHSAQTSVSQLENSIHHPPVHDDPSSSPWDWSDFLDFGPDDQLDISFASDETPASPISPDPGDPGRGRKRDPRLTCSNFLAGRIPCACPELDEKLEEEEGLPGKKRTRTARASAGTARCQVLGCEADISELKGYHRRHRVCLRCANASVVLLDGQRKRYCQQCGKFHILTDFDEGKRSCRRKLERHNNRRRGKSSSSRVAAEREPQGAVLADDVVCDDENGKDSTCLSSQIAEREPLLESEEVQVSALCSNPGSQNIQSDSEKSFVAFDDVQIDRPKDESKYAHSSLSFDNKNAYSSMCSTGRISFKLYDWNPAEFPRRLRHQIFQWLANMPVELEGYIRPGCTILTVFIAMPNCMWFKLLQDPVIYIRDFVASPGKMLSGRGILLVYLDNVIFRVTRDSVMQVKVEEQVPELHYVHPACFEAGKPMEFVACGSNLLQPKFRLLISFAGKYLAYDYSVPLTPLYGDTEEVTASIDHQLLKIRIPQTEPDLFGPAFIEVENESGLSNFIPILIGNKEICSEIKIMEHRFQASPGLKISKFMATTSSLSDSPEVSGLRQKAFSQFIVDTAWFLRKPALEDIKHTLISSQLGRFNHLLTFLIHNNSISILERVLHYMETVTNNLKLNCLGDGIADTDMILLQSNLDNARGILCERLQENKDSGRYFRDIVPNGNCFYRSLQIDMLSVIACTDQDTKTTENGDLDVPVGSNPRDHIATIPLSNKESPGKPCSRVFTSKYSTSRPLILIIAAASSVCFGICAVLLHPQRENRNNYS